MWKSATAATALTLTLCLTLASTAPAQGPSARTARDPASKTVDALPANSNPNKGSAPAGDPKVFQAEAELPGPVPLDKLSKPTIALPTDPIEPFLLTKEAGPFMVLAHTFRGPEATQFALALVKELRDTEHLPAFIFHLKIQPSHSNIRDVPPTAERHIEGGEKTRHPRYYDEAAVLVGNCKSTDESDKLLHRVKKMHPVCLDGLPSVWHIRKGQGLSRAMMTTNPYVAAQDIYPGKAFHHNLKAQHIDPGKAFDPSMLAAHFESNRKADPLIKKINAGPNSILHCPGQYTLSVAEFTGKSMAIAQDARFLDPQKVFGKGTLATASEEAEKFAAALAKNPALARTPYRPYVYHDRYSSRVTLGSFRAPDDPDAQALRKLLNEVPIEVATGKSSKVPDGKGGSKDVPEISFLTPAAELMLVPKP